MSKNIVTFYLVVFCIAATLLAGCIPEDSLEWSEDGSVGLLRIDGTLFLVDGNSGQLTEVTRENIQAWPDISKDGSLIAYTRDVECNDLSEGLKMLPPGQIEIIKKGAGRIYRKILITREIKDGNFPEPDEELLKPGDYKNWAIRYLCENADDQIKKVLGDKGITLGKEKRISYFQVVVVPVDNLNNKRVIATNIFGTVAAKLSPDNRYVSYIMQTQHGREEDEYSLYAASLEGDVKTMLIDERVALGYDWRKDSKAIAYLKSDSADYSGDDGVLGTLRERMVADDNNLLASPADNTSIQAYDCNSVASSYAGLIFDPWQKVRYGANGRIFFSTAAMSLPVSKINEGRWSLFCFDPGIGTVSDVLPQNVSNICQSLAMLQFELSPDGKKVLLPIKYNRFVIYELGTDSMDIPIDEDEEFGEEDISEFIPMWKGNNEISFMVSGKSHFLPEQKDHENVEGQVRNEIIILDETNNQSRILSSSWPDEIMDELKSDN
jgi:hypothetical protein